MFHIVNDKLLEICEVISTWRLMLKPFKIYFMEKYYTLERWFEDRCIKFLRRLNFL